MESVMKSLQVNGMIYIFRLFFFSCSLFPQRILLSANIYFLNFHLYCAYFVHTIPSTSLILTNLILLTAFEMIIAVIFSILGMRKQKPKVVKWSVWGHPASKVAEPHFKPGRRCKPLHYDVFLLHWPIFFTPLPPLWCYQFNIVYWIS